MTTSALAAPNAATQPLAVAGATDGAPTGAAAPAVLVPAAPVPGASSVASSSVQQSVTASSTSPWLAPDTTLPAGEFRQSSDGTHRLVMQTDGNLVVRRVSDNAVRWSSNTAGNAGARAVMQTDGNLVVYRTNNTAAWSSGTQATGAAWALVSSTGELRLALPESHNFRTVWSSASGLTGNTLSTLGAGQGLSAGQQVTSPDGTHRLVMQSDGNLVVRRLSDNTARWSSNTAGNTGAYMYVQTQGNIAVWSTSSITPQRQLYASLGSDMGVTRMSLGNDGVLRLELADGRAVWTSTGGLTGNSASTLAAGSQLAGGQRLFLSGSETPALSLTMGTDGNLVLHNTVSSVQLWSSNTSGNPGARAVMQTDGNLVVYRANNTAAWSSGTSGNAGARLAVDVRGRATVVHPTSGVRWQSLRPSVFEHAPSSQYVTGVSVWYVTDPGASKWVGLVDTTPGSQTTRAEDFGDATLASGRELVDTTGGVRVRHDGVNPDGSVRLYITVPTTLSPQPPAVASTKVERNTFTATLGSMDRSGVASFRLERTGTPDDPHSWQAVASAGAGAASIVYANADPGRWYYRVRSVGTNSTVSVWRGAYQTVVDTVAPTAVGGLVATGEGSTVRLRWNASRDPSSTAAPSRGLWYYQVRRNSVLVANVMATAELTYVDPNKVPGTTYQVVAVDGAANLSAPAQVVK